MKVTEGYIERRISKIRSSGGLSSFPVHPWTPRVKYTRSIFSDDGMGRSSRESAEMPWIISYVYYHHISTIDTYSYLV